MRLNRFLASCGLGSRRGCEDLVRQGRVAINDRPVNDLATRIGPGDRVSVDQRRVSPRGAVAILLNKPAGCLCSTRSQGARPTVFALLPRMPERLFPVGRLDADSEGLLLLTNDGDLAQHLAHPRHHVSKIYLTTLDKPFDPAHTRPLTRGMMLEGKPARFESVQPVGRRSVRIELRQGLKRQIRMMLLYLGYDVQRLVRIQFGPLRLGPLKPGEWRFLSEAEIRALRNPHPVPMGRSIR